MALEVGLDGGQTAGDGSPKGDWAGGEALGSAPSPAKPSATLEVTQHRPPPSTPSTSCGSGPPFFQFSFPRTATPCPPTPCPRFASSRLSPAPQKPPAKTSSSSGRREELRPSCCSAPGLPGVECLRHGIDRYFFSFFLFIKRLKQESRATNTKVSKGRGGSSGVSPRDGVLDGGDGVCPKAEGPNPARNSPEKKQIKTLQKN